jgi:O-antigen ligase
MSLTASTREVAAAPGSRSRAEVLVVLVATSVCLLPLLRPAGPGNTAVADVAMAGAVVIAAMWTSHRRLPLSFPYAAGVSLLVIGGALAANIVDAPLRVVLILVQDGFLLCWAATLALGRYDVAVVRAVTVTWCRVAVVYAGIGCVAYVIGLDAISGVSDKDGVRASYTFSDPNLAANYLVTSFFLMVACRRPRADSTRRIGYLLVLTAIGFTGSNGALLCLLVGGALCAALAQYRRNGVLHGVLALTLTSTLTAFLVLVVVPRIDLDQLREDAANSIPLLRDSVARSGSSRDERAIILDEGSQLFLSGDALGVGPARTKLSLQESQAPYVKEAHNDYLATLLERGLVGAIGLVLLVAAVLIRCWRLMVAELPEVYAKAVPRAYLLVVVAPVMGIASGFYEVLHFRHLWTWMGLIAALVLAEQDARRRAG